MRTSYSEAEVEYLISHYTQLRTRADTNPRRLWIVVRLADLERAMRFLRHDYAEAVFAYGLLGLDSRAAGEFLETSDRSVMKRYQRAIEELAYVMNGGY